MRKAWKQDPEQISILCREFNEHLSLDVCGRKKANVIAITNATTVDARLDFNQPGKRISNHNKVDIRSFDVYNCDRRRRQRGRKTCFQSPTYNRMIIAIQKLLGHNCSSYHAAASTHKSPLWKTLRQKTSKRTWTPSTSSIAQKPAIPNIASQTQLRALAVALQCPAWSTLLRKDIFFQVSNGPTPGGIEETKTKTSGK